MIPWFGGDYADIYDEIVFGPPPGTWKFIGGVEIDGALEYKLDTQQGPKRDGAKHSYQGYLPAKFSIGIQLATQDDLVQFGQLLEQLRPKPGKTIPPPIEVHHPWLDLYGLNQVLVPKLPFPKRIAPQLFRVTLNCLEYFAAVKDAGKVAAGPRPAFSTVFTPGAKPIVVTPQTHPRPSKTNTKPR